jgi:transposase
MDHYARLDISLEETSVCIVNGDGKVIRESKVSTNPEINGTLPFDFGVLALL